MAKLTDKTISEVMAAMGRRGAAARLAKMTPEERSEMMRKAAIKRWRAARKKKRKKNS